MIGTLAAHSGAHRVTRRELQAIAVPEGTATWKPVSHIDLLNVLEAEIYRRTMEIREEAYAVQRNGNLLFGVIDLQWRETEEFAAAIGIRTANDKTFSIQIAVGVRVFVCDNLVFAGDLIALRRRHTARLDLPKEMTKALDRYQEGMETLEKDIAAMKETALSDGQAKQMIHDIFRHGILPVRFFRPVSNTYFENKAMPDIARPSLWYLHNVCTWHIKQLPPAVAFQATTRLGQFFHLGQARPFESPN